MTLTFEAEISPCMSAREVVALAVQAEEAGFDRLGISCVALWPDTYQLQVLAAAATRRIHIGSMVTNPYTRHPAVHAAAVATLDDISDGRAFCGLGVGAGLEPLMIDYPQPALTLREAAYAVRDLLDGKAVSRRGQTLGLDDAQLRCPPRRRVPLAIGSRSPRVMRLAGELADIALVGARYLTPGLVAQYRRWVAEGAARVGRDPASVQILPRITLCISEDDARAVASVKRYAAHYLDILGDHGPRIDPARRNAIVASLREARGWYFDLERYDPPALLDLVDAELAQAFAVVGTPAQCAARLRALLAEGFTGVSCNLAPVAGGTTAEGLHETLTGAAEMLMLLRAG